jgi:hypothetical protein
MEIRRRNPSLHGRFPRQLRACFVSVRSSTGAPTAHPCLSSRRPRSSPSCALPAARLVVRPGHPGLVLDVLSMAMDRPPLRLPLLPTPAPSATLNICSELRHRSSVSSVSSSPHQVLKESLPILIKSERAAQWCDSFARSLQVLRSNRGENRSQPFLRFFLPSASI